MHPERLVASHEFWVSGWDIQHRWTFALSGIDTKASLYLQSS